MLKNILRTQWWSRIMKWGPSGGKMAERVRDNGERERERSEEEEEEAGSCFKDLFFFPSVIIKRSKSFH